MAAKKKRDVAAEVAEYVHERRHDDGVVCQVTVAFDAGDGFVPVALGEPYWTVKLRVLTMVGAHSMVAASRVEDVLGEVSNRPVAEVWDDVRAQFEAWRDEMDPEMLFVMEDYGGDLDEELTAREAAHG